MTVEELRAQIRLEIASITRHVVELSAYFTRAINELEARLDTLEGKETPEQAELFDEATP